jgi:hypothetical protein
MAGEQHHRRLPTEQCHHRLRALPPPPWQPSSAAILYRPSSAPILFELDLLHHGSRAALPSSSSSASSAHAKQRHGRRASSAMVDRVKDQRWPRQRTGARVEGVGGSRCWVHWRLVEQGHRAQRGPVEHGHRGWQVHRGSWRMKPPIGIRSILISTHFTMYDPKRGMGMKK